MLDFLDWSLINENDLVGLLFAASDYTAAASPFLAVSLRWLSILRSQFVLVGLCTPMSMSKLRARMDPRKQSGMEEGVNSKWQAIVPVVF